MISIPAWPEKPGYTYDWEWEEMQWRAYHKALAAAWEARCRVAVLALQQLAIGLPTGPGEEDGFTYDEAAGVANKALWAIGELPK